MKSGKARILLVSPMPPAMGGISVSSARLRDNLTADGYEVEMYDINSTSKLLPLGFHKLINMLWVPFYVLLNPRFDIVHFHVSSYWRRVWLWLTRFCFVRVKTVVTVHGDVKYYLRKPLSSLVMGFGDHIICVRQGDSALLPDRVRGKASDIPAFILPPDIDSLTLPDYVERFVAGTVESGLPLVVFNGGLVLMPDCYDLYGFNDVVDLLDKADAEGIGYRAIIVVNNSVFDRQQSEFLSRIESRLSGRGNILLCANTNFSLLPIFRQPGTVYVRPTKTDGDSLSIREALALGARVVASDAVIRPDKVICYRHSDINDFFDKFKLALSRNSDAGAGSNNDFYCRIAEVYSTLLSI
jgi:hypothetical protein